MENMYLGFLDDLEPRAVQLKCKNMLVAWCSLLVTEADMHVVKRGKKQLFCNVALNLFGEEST